METNPSENQKNVASVVHISTFAKFLFPFGNFLAPLLIWTTNKNRPFVDHHGKEAINFQLSILLYTLIIGLICLPFFVVFASDFIGLVEVIDDHVHEVSVQNIRNLSGYLTLFFIVIVLLFGIFVFELYAVITAAVKASKGKLYKYPLCIPFIKTTEAEPLQQPQPSKNQSENEHLS